MSQPPFFSLHHDGAISDPVWAPWTFLQFAWPQTRVGQRDILCEIPLLGELVSRILSLWIWRKLWLVMWWDINCVSGSRWGNEERAMVTARRAKTLLWRKGRKNRLLIIKSQIKSPLLRNKYDSVSYHTFIQQPVAGAASVYQVRQATTAQDPTDYLFIMSSHGQVWEFLHICPSIHFDQRQNNYALWHFFNRFGSFSCCNICSGVNQLSRWEEPTCSNTNHEVRTDFLHCSRVDQNEEAGQFQQYFK